MENETPSSSPVEKSRLWYQVPATMPEPEAGYRRPCPGGPPLIRLVNVSKSFDGVSVLRNISLDILCGQTTVILGPSGTGKSVMLKHIVGLLKPDAGEVYFEEQRVDHLAEPELVEIRKKIGFLFQMSALFDSLNVGQNVEFPLVEHTSYTAPERGQLADRVLRMVGLSGLQNKMPAELSGGQKKRVALARAIVLEPTVVLYDEPTTGLDPIRADLINELIIGLGRRLGITSVVVTHDMASAAKIADRMVLLYNGNIICDGDWDTFKRSDNELVSRFIQGQAEQSELDAIRGNLGKGDEGGEGEIAGGESP